MKFTKILLIAAVAGTLALGAGKALASSGQLTLGGDILTQKAVTTKKDMVDSSTESISLKDKNIYDIISRVVLNIGTNGTGLASTNLPDNGYIVFDPSGNDGTVSGTFYVTNKSGFYYPLSGLDTNDNYYSYIELDAYNNDTDNSAGQVNFGFSGNFNGVESGNYNTSTGDGTITVKSSAVFYAHDNPYSFNDGDNANVFYANDNSVEIRGLAEIKIEYKSGEVSKWSFSLSGDGNAVVNGTQAGLVSGGKVSASDQH